MFNQCASATFFARFVFDIQFLQNLLDFLAVIGAVCVQGFPDISLAHKLFQNDAVVRTDWRHSVVGDQGCARIRILVAACVFILIDWNLS